MVIFESSSLLAFVNLFTVIRLTVSVFKAMEGSIMYYYVLFTCQAFCLFYCSLFRYYGFVG